MVGVNDDGRTVGDDDGGPPLRQCSECFLGVLLGVRVGLCNRLAEEKHWRVGGESSGQCGASSLTPWGVDPFSINNRVVVFGQFKNAFVGAYRAGDGFGLLVNRRGVGEEDIRLHRIGDESSVLEDSGEFGEQSRAQQLGDRDASNEDPPFVNISESDNELDEC